ncbi:hypothetical protein SLE2022_152120 [Rubroshorea leprosula]
MSNDITYICKRTVVSTKPVQPGKFFSFSVLDRLMEQNHLRIVYYYQTGGDAGELGKATKKLRESLSELLTNFPIMTGRLQKNSEGHWMIKCNDAGVRMIEAKAKGSVEEWLTSVNREKELKLVYWEEMFHKPHFWSTVYVQLTEFEEGGLAIGLSCIHLLTDPFCATVFLKAWANQTLIGNMLAPPFFHPLPPRRAGNKNPTHQPYTDLINHYKFSIERPTPFTNKKQATVALTFKDHMVRDCMAMSRASSTGRSPFEALAALFWVCISKLKGKTKGLLNMSVCLDMRKVLNLDTGFFGNCMVYNKVHVGSSSNCKNMLQEAANGVGEVIQKMDIEGIMDLIEWLRDNGDDHLGPVMNGWDLVCAKLEEIEPYEVMFEDGFGPIRVSYYVEPVFGVGQVLVLPSPASEGPMSRVVMVTLSEEEVVKLCQDDLIKRFCPAIMMFG